MNNFIKTIKSIAIDVVLAMTNDYMMTFMVVASFFAHENGMNDFAIIMSSLFLLSNSILLIQMFVLTRQVIKSNEFSLSSKEIGGDFVSGYEIDISNSPRSFVVLIFLITKCMSNHFLDGLSIGLFVASGFYFNAIIVIAKIVSAEMTNKYVDDVLISSAKINKE